MSAAIIFTQGATVGPAGQSVFGVVGTPVVVSNGGAAGLRSVFTVVYSPLLSAVPIGVAQDGATPTWSFTPDVPNGYTIQLDVYDSGGGVTTSIQQFGVKLTTGGAAGLYIPGYTRIPSQLNFGGNPFGWAPYEEALLNYLASLTPGGGGTGLTIANLVSGPATIAGAANTKYPIDLSTGAVVLNIPVLGAKQSIAYIIVAGDPSVHSLTVNGPGGVGLTRPPPNNDGSAAGTYVVNQSESQGSGLQWTNYGVSNVYTVEY